MTALPEERLLLRVHKGELLLTTHRVRYQQQGDGRTAIVSMLLEEVDSCSMVRNSHPWLLMCAAVALVIGLFLGLQRGQPLSLNETLGGVLVAGVFVIVYLFSRWQVVEIASSASRIFLALDGWSVKEVINLFDQIEAAKSARMTGVEVATQESEPAPA